MLAWVAGDPNLTLLYSGVRHSLAACLLGGAYVFSMSLVLMTLLVRGAPRLLRLLRLPVLPVVQRTVLPGAAAAASQGCWEAPAASGPRSFPQPL